MIKFSILFLIPFLCIACQNDYNKAAKVASSQFPKKQASIEKVFSLPKKVTFAGEKVPLNDIEVAERLDRELQTNAFWQSNMYFYLKRSKRYFPFIDSVLAAHQIPLDFKYLCVAESGLTQAQSYAGALGFWQFMPQTAKEYNLIINRFIDERMSIEKSTVAACNYLNDSKKKLGNWTLVAASYNRGQQGIQNDLESQEMNSFYDLYLNSETSRYVFRIIAIKLIMENPINYNFNLSKNEYYSPYKTKYIAVKEDIDDLTKFALEHKTSLKILKLLNPWLINSQVKIPHERTSIELKLPSANSKLTVVSSNNN
jgi:hypothetical protein